jgi:hypothetical protein
MNRALVGYRWDARWEADEWEAGRHTMLLLIIDIQDFLDL